jgi:cholesterol oxidase
MAREIPLYTLAGIRDAEVSTHPFTTADNLGLSLLRFRRRECDDVVVIIHGLTTSSDMFIMPEHENLVSFLLDRGFADVWTLDFRMSNRHSYNLAPHRYSMDDCALYDHPAAIAKVREAVGEKRIHVICHCLGSMSFVMSLFAKQVTGIASVVANSVALTPRVHTWSRIKGTIFPFLLERVLDIPYVSPRWSDDPYLSRGKVLGKLVSLFHRECEVPACHMLSLMWGTGWPALYEHENLAEVTHRRGGDLYGGTSLNYHRHALKMAVNNNTAVKMYPENPLYADLPENYFEYAAEIETPVLFMTGTNNRVFTDSNQVCYRRLRDLAPGNPHELLEIEGYGHQDVFMGRNVAQEVFPRFLPFLEKHAA